ncbi:uncharacterized protein BJ212DRAFT_1578083 [Suillus subaureus]|uniref:DUF6534 domain-containing protein n=1 Tax=Suillus subaureus TaxID=48587 RepID=A0A9P7JC40_9AGAM|nr:uncharacterized protein BJ212DRAFT_1578083 [Suillus subaureus]KAG1813877.1 hypothetical protein BJ212DRAFT_1578083 [Suillus subaureus]
MSRCDHLVKILGSGATARKYIQGLCCHVLFQTTHYAGIYPIGSIPPRTEHGKNPSCVFQASFAGSSTAPLIIFAMSIGLIYGAMMVGGLLAFGLSGCVNMQFIVYFRVYFRESWRTKSLVIVIWLLDLSHSALVAVALWDSIIATYGDLSKIDTIPWCIGPTIELTALITFLVQSFFAYRIYKLQNKKLSVAIPIVALSFARLIMASVTNSEMLKLKSYTTFFQRFSWVFTFGLLLSVIVDIMITTFLCYFLRKNRPMFTDTMRIIDTLTFWTIQNGSMTSAAAIATLLCWKIMPSNRIFLGIHFVVAKLYANSLLATLNARKQIWNGKQYTPTNNQPMPIVFMEHGPDSSITQQGSLRVNTPQPKAVHQRGKLIQVNVEQIVESKGDGCMEMDMTDCDMKDSPV